MLKSRSLLRCLSMSCLVLSHSSLSITVVGSSFSLWRTEQNMRSASAEIDIELEKNFRGTHLKNYFEGVPAITYNKQVTLPIPISTSWNRDLFKEKKTRSAMLYHAIRSLFLLFCILVFV